MQRYLSLKAALLVPTHLENMMFLSAATSTWMMQVFQSWNSQDAISAANEYSWNPNTVPDASVFQITQMYLMAK